MPAGLRALLVRLFGFKLTNMRSCNRHKRTALVSHHAPHIILRSSGSWRMSGMSSSNRFATISFISSDRSRSEDAGFGYRIGMSKGLKL